MQTQGKQESSRNWRAAARSLGCLGLLMMGAVLTPSTAFATVTAGNSFYLVHVQDTPGLGVGQYTITTGPSHPAGVV